MSDLDCYLFVDSNLPQEQQTISPICIECHDSRMPDVGIFYNGSKEGYSDFDWNCCLCGKYIHKSEGSQDEEGN